MKKQPLEIQTLYAELLERVAAFEAARAIGHVSGTFVTKTIKGHEYYYFQHIEPGDKKRQIYVGRRDAALDAVVSRYADSREDIAADTESIRRICTLLRAGGAMTTDAASARVLGGLADAGVFRLGGVLVGTHAFAVLGNVLGVVWSGAALRTQDVDVAAEQGMSIAVPDLRADVPGVLEALEMGFLPVPGLDRMAPSTSFKVRGQGLRVDLVTPASRGGGRPIRLARLGAAAQPLRFLEYVLERPIAAAVVDGGGISVQVPEPARFALHKLIVAGERPATMHSKREKDLWQAAQVLEVLLEERPGDITLGWEGLAERGRGWVKRAQAGLSAMQPQSAEVAEGVRGLTLA